MPFRLADGGGDLKGAQLLANILALPEELGNRRIEAGALRTMYRNMGVPEEQINQYAPGEDKPEPVGGTGLAGKILSGIGKTGAVLSTVLGSPVKAPRVDFGEVKSATEQGYREHLAGMENDPRKKDLLRLGQYGLAYGGAGGDQPKNLMALLYQQGKSLGLEGPALTNWMFEQYPKMQANITGATTGARKDITTSADAKRKAWSDENTRRGANGLPPLPEPPGGFVDERSDAGGINLGPNSIHPTKFMQGLADRGFTPEQSAAIAGNVHVESAFDPGKPSGVPGENSVGFLQWNKDRLAGLQNYATQNKLDWRDPSTQMDWIAMERDGRSMEYGGSDERATYRNALDRGGSPEDMAVRFGQLVERPKRLADTADLRARMAGEYHGALLQPTKVLAEPVQVASNDATVGFPSPAPGLADSRGLTPAPLPGQPAAAPLPAAVPPAPAVPATAPVAVPPAAGAPAPPAGPGLPPESGGKPFTGKTLKVGDTTYDYKDRTHIPGWIEAAQRLNLPPETEDSAQADQIMNVVREEKRRGEKMDLFDLAAYANNLPPRGPYTAQQAEQIRGWMRQYEQEPSLRGQMARMRVVKDTLETLVRPVQSLDRRTLQPRVDKDGNPVYLRKANGDYLTPIETLTDNPVFASVPFVQGATLTWAKKQPGGEAINQLLMAQGEMANFVKAAGDSGNASEQEQSTQMRAFIPNENDTVLSALSKVRQGLARARRYEDEMTSRFRQTKDDSSDIGGPGGHQPGGTVAAPAAPAAPKAPAAPSQRVMTLDEYLAQ